MHRAERHLQIVKPIMERMRTKPELSPYPFLYIWSDVTIYYGELLQHLRRHSGATYLLGICLRGTLAVSVDQGKTWARARTVLFRPGCERQIRSLGAQCVFISIEPHLPEGRLIEKIMRRKISPGFLCDIRNEEHYCGGLAMIINGSRDPASIRQAIREVLFSRLGRLTHRQSDRRVFRAIEYMNGNLVDGVTISELAGYVALSESRLQHLFKQHTSITLRQYLTWIRVKHAFNLITQGTKVTVAGMMSGFSHGTYLSRVFPQLHGFALSSLFSPSYGIDIRYLGPAVDDSASRLHPPAVTLRAPAPAWLAT